MTQSPVGRSVPVVSAGHPTALTMKSVGVAANAMVLEVKNQFRTIEHIREYGTDKEVKDANGKALGKPTQEATNEAGGG